MSHYRTAVPGMRTDLGQPGPLHLRRLFLSSGSRLRPMTPCARRFPASEFPSGRRICGRYSLSYCPSPGISARVCRWASRHCCRRRGRHETGRVSGESLPQKRRRLPSYAEFQRPRPVALALAQAREFGFDTVSCSSTGNLANAVAYAAREGLKAWIFHSV